MGICGYYRRFIRDIAKIVAPLYKLLKKDVKWQWTEKCNEAFTTLKQKLISFPFLRKTDFTKEFIVHTDASGLAIGAVLAQKDVIMLPGCLKATKSIFQLLKKSVLQLSGQYNIFEYTYSAKLLKL
jgi:hypothetical protein